MVSNKILIGLTGGIGSGKSTVANFFEKEGFPVYNSDTRAKILQNENKTIKQQIINIFGIESYINEKLNTKHISSIVFNDANKLKQLNAIVHPKVYEDFNQWLNNQTSKYVIKEAAILIESGSYKDCDIIINVFADLDIRVKRVTNRDNITEKQVIERINNQLTDEERNKYATYSIDNSKDLNYLQKQVKALVKVIKDNY